MGTDGNAVNAVAVTPLDVDAVTVVAIDMVVVVVTVAMLRIQQRHDTASLNKSR